MKKYIYSMFILILFNSCVEPCKEYVDKENITISFSFEPEKINIISPISFNLKQWDSEYTLSSGFINTDEHFLVFDLTNDTLAAQFRVPIKDNENLRVYAFDIADTTYTAWANVDYLNKMLNQGCTVLYESFFEECP